MKSINLHSILLGAFLLAFTIGVAWGGGPQEFTDGVSGITATAVRRELMGLPPKLRFGLNKKQMSRLISSMLVDDRMMAAAKKAGVENMPEVKARLARARREIFLGALLDSKKEKWAASLPNIDGMAKDRYRVNHASYFRPEAIKVAEILIRVEPQANKATESAAKAKADKLLAEIKGGADFAKLARQYSQDSSSAHGGELPGWVNKKNLVPAFAKLAFSLKPGEIGGPVRTRFGYHIIKLIAHRKAGVPPYDEIKDQIKQQIRGELLEQKRQEYLKSFRGKHSVVVTDEQLKALERP